MVFQAWNHLSAGRASAEGASQGRNNPGTSSAFCVLLRLDPVDLGRCLSLVWVRGPGRDGAALSWFPRLELLSLHQAKQILEPLTDAGYGNRLQVDPESRAQKARELAPGEIEKILGLPVYAVLPSELSGTARMLLGRKFAAGAQFNWVNRSCELAMRMAGIDEPAQPKKKFGLF